MKTFFRTLIVMMSVIFLLPAYADTGQQALPTTLEVGSTSDSRLIPEVEADRFNIKVDTEQQVTISSELLPGEESYEVTIKATLKNEAGEAVATKESSNGNFEIKENLTPGNYVLTVNGKSLQTGHQSASRYSIHVSRSN